jgi:hypothetical protein
MDWWLNVNKTSLSRLHKLICRGNFACKLDPMKFFIDTANLDQIKEAHDLGVLDGVTTNPSLMFVQLLEKAMFQLK